MSKKRVGGIAIVVGFIVLFFITLTGAEEKISPAKEELIEEVIETAGVEREAVSFFTGASFIMVTFLEEKVDEDDVLPEGWLGNFFKLGQKSGSGPDVKGAEKLIDNFIETEYYPIFNKHFSETELKDLVSFFKSPLGRKFTEVISELNCNAGKQLAEFSEGIVKGKSSAVGEAEESNKKKCMSNLRQIGMALKMYAVDYDGQFPANIEDVYPRYVYVLDANIFRCPAGDSSAIGSFVSYAYVSGLTEAHPGNTIIVYDSSVTNHGDGRNVLFVDGHVEWMGEKEFQEALKKSLIQRSKKIPQMSKESKEWISEMRKHSKKLPEAFSKFTGKTTDEFCSFLNKVVVDKDTKITKVQRKSEALVVISGESNSFNALASLITRLQISEYFDNESIKVLKAELHDNKVAFSLECPLRNPENMMWE